MSAREKPAGSATPFSLAHFSHRSIFCILPEMIWVRCTVAFSCWQTSQIIILFLAPEGDGHNIIEFCF
jgi:hypothetical protein